MPTKVYTATSTDINKYIEKGFILLPAELTKDEIILCKQVKIPKDSQLVQSLIKVYEDPKWQHYAFGNAPFDEWVNTDLGRYFAGIGLNWERVSIGDGLKKVVKLLDEPEVMDTLTTWRLEILMSDPDKIMRMGPLDFSFPNPLYPASWIYEYVKDEIKSLGKLIKVKTLKE